MANVVLPPAVLAVIERAGRLTRDEVVRLDLAERRRADILPTVWDLLRDRLRAPGVHELRMEARNAAWEAVAASLFALGIEPLQDDGYWRVVQRVGAGAHRAARYAACGLVAPELLDEEWLEILMDPWMFAIRDWSPDQV